MGQKPSKARYYLDDTGEVIKLLRSLASAGGAAMLSSATATATATAAAAGAAGGAAPPGSAVLPPGASVPPGHPAALSGGLSYSSSSMGGSSTD